MRIVRLHVDLPLTESSEIILPDAAARHAARVLRLRTGDRLTVFNGDGHDYPGRLGRVEGRVVIVHTESRTRVDNEPPFPVILGQCLAKGDKMDLVIQKATELGVSAIVPLLGERCDVRLDAARAQRRVQHWQAVAASACEQCGRARLPQIVPPLSLSEWLRQLDASCPAQRLVLVPGSARRARDVGIDAGGVIVAIGPEGGFGPRDNSALAAAGFNGLALGPRILRTETAGFAAIAALLACHGDL